MPVKKRAKKKAAAESPATAADAPLVAPGNAGESGVRRAPVIAQSKPKALLSAVRDDIGVPDDILAELKGTTGWLMFAAVFQFLGALACLVIGGLLILQAVLLQGSMSAGEARVSVGSLGAIAVAVGFLIGMSIYLMLGLRMVRFCNAVGRVRQSGDEHDLEFVLGYLRGIWQILGASILVMLVLSVISALIAR